MEKNVFIWGNSVFVSYQFLYDMKVPPDVVYKNTTKGCKQQWYVKRHYLNRRLKLIAYNSIPQKFVDEYNLPGVIELKSIYEIESKKNQEDQRSKVSKVLRTILDFEYESWETITDVYKNEYFEEQKLESFCRTHLLLSKVVELTNFGFKFKDLYKAYIQYEGLVFETISYHSFCNKIRKIKKSNCIEDELLHGLRKKESNNHKMSDDIIIEIKSLYSNPKKYSAGIITKKINEYLLLGNRKRISRSSVEKLIAQTWFKNECMISRYGDKFTEEHLLPYLPFIEPKFEGSLWLIDGTRFQFAYLNERSKIDFLTYFIIMEGKTRKIIGYSCDESENHQMVKEAFKMACKNTGFLPREIISDGSSAYKAKEFSRIISNLRDWGVIWRMVKNPKDNGYAERSFGVIQSCFCKGYDGYIGDGITSKNLDGKPTPEELKKYYANKKIKSKVELIELIKTITNDYNSSKDKQNFQKKANNTLSDNELMVQPIKLNSIMVSKLFWNQNILMLHNGMISFSIKNKQFYFNTYSYQVITKYSGNKVRVRYDLSNLSLAMIFDLNSDEFICKLRRVPDIAKPIVERTDQANFDLHEHSRKKRRLKNKLLEKQRELETKVYENRELLPPELIEIFPLSKQEREKIEDELVLSEINDLSTESSLKTFNVDEEISFEEIFKNLYRQEGNLKIYNHGRN